jgi:drug/metabolite transporter (DMT)-like permease
MYFLTLARSDSSDSSDSSGARAPHQFGHTAVTVTTGSSRAPQSSTVGQGIMWMLLAMFMFASMDASVKYLVKLYPTAQVVWARFFFHLILIAMVFMRRIPSLIQTKNRSLQLGRSVLLLSTTVLFFTGLRFVPLAEASSMMMVSPLIVTALSMPLLREPVGPKRWTGVAIGFCGALIIIRPGADIMQLAVLFPLAAAATYALYQISTRFLSQSDPVLTTLFYSAIGGTLLTSFVVPFVWVSPSPEDWLLMLYMGLCGGLGHFAVIKSLNAAPAAAVVPFTYTGIIWATSYGFFLYGDFPDNWTLLGAGVVAASGLYIFFREQKHHRR